jgi:hypothetical protein
VIYYKATKPDGTDFYTGTVDYAGALASGEPLPLLTSTDGTYERCTGSVYHASDAPAETLVGSDWPCRLFEVTGEPVTERGHTYGFRTLAVVREVYAWMALGPNGEAVLALIERARNLTPTEASGLISAWGTARDAAWHAARDAAWHAARGAAWNAAWYAAWYAAWDVAWGAAGDVPCDAAGDAAVALVVKDLISPEHFYALYSPWASVMEMGSGQ